MVRALVLILFCLCIGIPVSGQPNAQCGDIRIVSPEYLDPWDSRSFSARTGTGEPVTVDWTLVKENYRTKRVEVESIRQKESVKPQLWDSNDSGILTAIATATSTSGCSMTAAVHTMVIERTGSPLVIDEYGKISRNFERARLDVVLTEMNTRPKHNLLVYLYFRRTDQLATARLRMTQILSHVVMSRKFDPKRIIFLIGTSDRTYVRLQIASRNESEVVANFPEYLVVKAEQFDDYKKLFQ